MLRWSVNAALAGDLALILLAAGVGGLVFRRLRQPPVLGEVIAGLLLGPTILGGWSDHLFPAQVQQLLSGVARVSVILFMFAVGLEVDRQATRENRRLAMGVGLVGTMLPLALGVAAAPFLIRRAGLDFWPFAIFVGTALSVTAFPVLARIVAESDLRATPLGQLVMLCAAADDALTWITLAVALALLPSSHGPTFWQVLMLAALIAVVMFGLVRPLLARADRHFGLVATEWFPFLLALAFTTSWISSGVGMRAIYGAFLAGAVVPRPVASAVLPKLETVNAVLLPAFFVSTGLTVNLRHLDPRSAADLVALLVLATVGKVVGTWLPARLSGIRAAVRRVPGGHHHHDRGDAARDPQAASRPVAAARTGTKRISGLMTWLG